MSIRKRVVVSGKVQGVFFRSRTQDMAEDLGLTGWVRNRPDGKVEAEFQGPEDAVALAVDFCHHGSEQARVDDVAVHDANPVDGERGFAVW